MKHFLDLEHLPAPDAQEIIRRATIYKAQRGKETAKPLQRQTWALIFSKSSTRTRVSFEVGIREMGGACLFLNANDIQLGRGEPIKDTARVLGRMIHGAVIRTFAQQDIVDFARYSDIPTINALTDDEHPCQIIADILTYIEKRGSIAGRKVAFIGDAACNVPRSWAFASRLFDFDLVCAAPPAYACGVSLPRVKNVTDPREAAHDADLLYTDVWVSMGKEAEAEQRLRDFVGYQINDELLKLAKPDALVLHCLPAYRGKEITDAMMESRAQDIFDEAENRLHAQKAIIDYCLR